MRLLAISDLHLANAINREALDDIPDHGEDWIILAGDIAEREQHLALAFTTFAERFARVIWVPGNHELWTLRREGDVAEPPRGDARYRHLIDLARAHGVVTPEDGFVDWPGAPDADGRGLVIAPLFLLYDYSFRPADVAREDLRAWAEERHTVCSDEFLLHPDPYPTREAWCAARLAESERRLGEIPGDRRPVLINHWPLRRDLIHIPRVPRFTPWCGTVETEDWHRRFRAAVVVSGHLHTRRTDWRDGTRFEEVSLGYPRQWRRDRGIADYMRVILPA